MSFSLKGKVRKGGRCLWNLNGLNGISTHSCLEIYLTSVVWTCHTFENNFGMKHKFAKYYLEENCRCPMNTYPWNIFHMVLLLEIFHENCQAVFTASGMNGKGFYPLSLFYKKNPYALFPQNLFFNFSILYVSVNSNKYCFFYSVKYVHCLKVFFSFVSGGPGIFTQHRFFNYLLYWCLTVSTFSNNGIYHVLHVLCAKICLSFSVCFTIIITCLKMCISVIIYHNLTLSFTGDPKLHN